MWIAFTHFERRSSQVKAQQQCSSSFEQQHAHADIKACSSSPSLFRLAHVRWYTHIRL